jgi:hypothetical protein
MKAIYEVKFMVKREPANVADVRRVAGDASTKGFKKILAWAESVTDDEEMVGSIAIVACEKL